MRCSLSLNGAVLQHWHCIKICTAYVAVAQPKLSVPTSISQGFTRVDNYSQGRQASGEWAAANRLAGLKGLLRTEKLSALQPYRSPHAVNIPQLVVQLSASSFVTIPI